MVARYGRATGATPDRALMDLVEALSMGLAGLTRAREIGEKQPILDLARHLEKTGDNAGLPLLRLAAMSVVDCAERGDDVALAATSARCLRMGDAAITALWSADFGHG